MSSLSEKALPAVEKLLQSSEDQLYEQLAMRTAAIEENPALAGQFDIVGLDPATHAGRVTDGLKNVGLRIFNRWNREAFNLVCGSETKDKHDRDKLLTAFDMGSAAFASAVASSLVTGFGIAPAIAAVVASIVVTRFLRGAYEEFCTYWQENLPQPT
jgi:hydroxymethylpyrimidine/phosphomethylpyrimidine kinase